MPQYTNVIENQTFNSTLRLVGSQWDNTIIRNVTIQNVNGDGAILRHVKNVTFENVTIVNVSGDGIKLSTMGSTSNVVIKNSTISKIGEDGINAGQRDGVDHPGLQIIGNKIDSTGLNGSGDGLLHGIYVQSTDFLIENNRVTNSEDGNGISVRSWGAVRENHVESSEDSGIAYFADHKGSGGSLLIEGNTVLKSGSANGRTDINLLNVPNSKNLVDSITVRDNDVERGDDGIRVSRGYEKTSVTISAPSSDSGNGGTRVAGDSGDNIVRGDADDNSMFGGAGADIFVFDRNGGSDWIEDFTAGVDRIAVVGFSDLNSTRDLAAIAFEEGGHTVITAHSGESMTILDTQISDFSESDFIFV